MDTNAQLQQINTFTKGMNTDTSDLYLPSDQYRMAKNLKFTASGGSNQGELHLIEGNKLKKLTDYDGNEVKFGEILATTNVAEYGIIVSKETIKVQRNQYELTFGYNDVTGEWPYPQGGTKNVFIGYDVNNPTDLPDQLIIRIHADLTSLIDNTPIERTKVVMYNPGDLTLANAQNNIIKEIPIVEDGENFRIYKANIDSCEISGNNTYRFRYIEPTGNTFYREFNGGTSSEEAFSIWRFTQNENSCRRIFGPCQKDIWSVGIDLTTKYTSNNDIELYILTGTVPVFSIDVVNEGYESLDFKPETDWTKVSRNAVLILKPASVRLVQGGSIPARRIQYAYRYTDGRDSYSQLSPLSKIISLYDTTNSGYSTGTQDSNKSVQINIPTVQTSYSNLQIFRIHVDEQPTKVYKIYDSTKTNDFVDVGGTNKEVSEFSSYYNLLANSTVPAVFSSKGGAMYSNGTDMLSGSRLYEANIKDVTTGVNIEFKNIDTRSFSSGMYFIEDGAKKHILDNSGQIVNLPDVDADLFHEGFDDNPQGDYRSNSWKVGNNYGGIGRYFKWEYTYNKSLISDLQQSTNINEQPTTFKYGEVYRFGVILYDLDGNRSSVKWIADIQMPNQPGDYAELAKNEIIGAVADSSGVYGKRAVEYTVRNIGVKFTLLDKIPNCSQFEIVRCIRDKYNDTYNISQGIVGFPVEAVQYNNERQLEPVSYSDVTEPIFPYGPLSLQPIVLQMGGSRVYGMPLDENNTVGQFNPARVYAQVYRNVVQFASPEYLYDSQFTQRVPAGLSSDIYLRLVHNYQINYVEGSNPLAMWIGGYEFQFLCGGSTEYENRVHKEGLKEWVDGHTLQQYRHQRPYLQICTLGGYDESLYGNPMDINTIKMKEVQYPGVPKFDEFFDYASNPKRFNFTSTSKNAYIVADGETKTFVPFSSFFVQKYANLGTSTAQDVTIPLLYYFWNGDNSNDMGTRNYTYLSISGAYSYPVGSSGKCILMSVGENQSIPSVPVFQPNNVSEYRPLLITIANIVHSANPYGGYNRNAIDASSYYSFGDVYTNNENTIADIHSGDAYIKLFKYNSLHSISHFYIRYPYTAAFIYCIPVVSEIDLQGTSGTLYDSNMPGENAYYLQDEASRVPKSWTGDGNGNAQTYEQPSSAYLYDYKYSALYYALAISSTGKMAKSSSTNVSRIVYSNVEDWESSGFEPSNYIDVDSGYGEITCLAAYKDKLIFWQEHAVGYISVNEKSAIVDSNSNEISLGTGDLLKKPFYISNVYGMKSHQLCYCVTTDNLYWWDGYNKEILRFNERGGVQPLSKTKNIQQYLHSGEENDDPHMYFDVKNSEVICSCVNEESIVFNELADTFSSVYTFSPKHSITIHENHYSLDKTNLYLNNVCEDNGAMLFGEPIFPYLKYVINKQQQVKTFNNISFGGRFYGGSEETTDDSAYEYYQDLQKKGHTNSPLSVIDFVFKTPLKQEGRLNGSNITNREYDFRASVPRAGKTINGNWVESTYGDRLRGRTMECEMKSSSNSTDFSLQYINTKFNISCS